MKDLASSALDTATQRGATYADVRVIDDRSRGLATKNGKIANASDSQSQGFSVRVLMNGAWGFASSADLGRSSVEATAARAVEIARASAKVKQSDVKLVPEQAVTAEFANIVLGPGDVNFMPGGTGVDVTDMRPNLQNGASTPRACSFPKLPAPKRPDGWKN